MSFLIYSGNVFTETELDLANNEKPHCKPVKGNIGSLPTLFCKHGLFNCEANSYFFYLKSTRNAKDLSPAAKALQAYYQFLEDNDLSWNHFPPIKRLKPTYLFRSHLLKQIKQSNLAHSTASIRMNHVVNYYKWLMYEGYLDIRNHKEAPFITEEIAIKNTDKLAHMSPTFIVQSSDLRIKIPTDANSNNIRPLKPLSQDFLNILTLFLPKISEELCLQILISIDTGLRIQEIASLTLDALDTVHPLAESEHRYELHVSPHANAVQTKFAKPRNIEISSNLLGALNVYRTSERRLNRVAKLNKQLDNLFDIGATLKQETIDLLERCERHEPLFISEQGNPVSAKSIEARWSEFRAMIKKEHPAFTYRFHDLRATYGTYRLSDLLDAKLPDTDCIALLMGWMGHRHESTTWKYLQFLRRKEIFKVKFGILDSIMHEAIGCTHE